MQPPTTLDKTAEGLRTEYPFGIRFRLSVVLLLGALNLVAMVTLLVWSAPVALNDLRPVHGAAWEASRRVEAFHLQTMVDAIAARESSVSAEFPEEDFDVLRETLRSNLGDDFGAVEPQLEYLHQVTRRWYEDGQTIPEGYVIELPTLEEVPSDEAAEPGEAGWDEFGGTEQAADVEGDEPATETEAQDVDDGAVPPAAAGSDDAGTDPPAPDGEAGGEAAGSGTEEDPDIGDGEDGIVPPAGDLDAAQLEADFREVQLAYFGLQQDLSDGVSSRLVANSELLRPLLGYAIAWISVMAAFFIYFSFRLRTVFSLPLGKVMKAAVSIGQGNLETPVEIPTHRSELETLAVVLDTMRANLQHQIAEREKEFLRMSTILAGMREGVLLVDRDWSLQLFNPAVEELLGLSGNPGFRVGVDVRLLGIEALARDPDGMGHEGSTELLAVLTDEETADARHTRITRYPLKDADERYQGFVAVIRDITQEKEMDQMKNDFFSMVTHELKTPLTPIEGYVKLMVKERAGPVTDQQKRFLGIIASQTTLLKGMIQDLLDMSRIASGRLSLNVGSVEVAAMAERVVERFGPPAHQQGIELVFQPGDHEAQLLRGDEVRLEQVLGNLIGNALKFTPVEGTITVRSAVADGVWTAHVVDTGMGIPEAALARIFEKFFQVEKGDTRSVGGAGLGLYICREIVSMHNGKITVESVLGEGTEFTVRIPLDGPPDVADTL